MKRRTQSKRKSQKKNLVYMAQPIYGGWVTMTAHLSLKYNYPLFRVGNRTENNSRDYGYGVKYNNISKEDLKKMTNVLITAIDKHYYQFLEYLPKSTSIIIHDPTEVKTSEKNPNPLLKYLPKFKVFTIRETVQEYLAKNFKIRSTFNKHPFFEYPIIKGKQGKNSMVAVSISRIDFDKNTDIILKANKLIHNPKDKIIIYGAENRMYVFHKLQSLGFKKYYKGKFNKTLPASINKNQNILEGVKFVVDLSVIKNDGGGTQYTFLEAIHQGCTLVLHKKWVNQKKSIFKNGVNCLAVETPEELASIFNNTSINVSAINKSAKRLLKNHTCVVW